MKLPQRFAVGLNKKIIGKCSPDKTSYSGAFRATKVNWTELAEHISKGHPWMPGILAANDRRWQHNVRFAECIAVDIDHGLTIEQALAHPFIAAHASLLIESSSSTPGHHKFRIGFRLPERVNGWEDVRIVFRYLVDLIGEADPACKDASRFFFGGLDRTARLLDEEACLPQSFVADALAWQAKEDEQHKKDALIAHAKAQKWIEENGSEPLEDAAEALKFINPYSPGENRYGTLVTMIGGVLNTFGTAGVQLLKGWGEQGDWGKSWDKVLRSIENSRPARPATINTLFYLAKEAGYKPARKKRSPNSGAGFSSTASKKTIETPDHKKPSPLTATPGYEMDYGYLPNHSEVLFPAMKLMRLIVMRSDCGTGKSRIVEGYVKWLKANSEDEIPVISAGHRTTLGEAQGEMFGIPFKTEINEYGNALGMSITLDSAHRKSAVRYHGDRTSSRTIFILDEADQCIDHMVGSKTDIKYVRQEVIEEICETGQRAAQVISVSAGLRDRHVEILQQSMGISEAETLRIVNTHKRDMGNVYRCYSDKEAWFLLDKKMSEGKKCIAKLSGAKTESIYSTKTAVAWFSSKRVLVLDHDAIHDPSNRETHLEAETIVRGTGGAYACEIIHTEDGIKPRLTEQKIISYLMHPDSWIRAERQSRIFAPYDLVVYTNSCGTGVSFEAGDFEYFGQIENGAGNIDDMMQSTARYRPIIERGIFAKANMQPSYGNGSSDPLKLQAGNDNNWDAQQWAIASANADWLPDNALLVEGNLGLLWRGYSYQMQAERNKQAHNYANEFFALLTEANYKVSDAIMPEWEALGKEGQNAFGDAVKKVKDANADADNAETSDRNVEGVDIKKLSDKRERTKEEQQQLKKLKAMDRYGLEADEVSPELIKREKKGMYRRLENRYYLEKGLKAAAERDAAKDRQTNERGRTWREDRLSGAQAYKHALQQQIGLDVLKAQLESGLVIHQYSPEVAALIEKMVESREQMKETFRTKVGEEVETFIDGKFITEIEVARPITIVKTMLKRLELDLKSAGTVQIDGKQVRIYSLIDLLDGENGPLIDYEKFVAHKDKSDREIISKAPPVIKAETIDAASDAGDDAVNHAVNNHAIVAIKSNREAGIALNTAHESGPNDSLTAAQSVVCFQYASADPEYCEGGVTAAAIESEPEPIDHFATQSDNPLADNYFDPDEHAALWGFHPAHQAAS